MLATTILTISVLATPSAAPVGTSLECTGTTRTYAWIGQECNCLPEAVPKPFLVEIHNVPTATVFTGDCDTGTGLCESSETGQHTDSTTETIKAGKCLIAAAIRIKYTEDIVKFCTDNDDCEEETISVCDETWLAPSFDICFVPNP